MTDEDNIKFLAVLLVLAFVIVANVWWLPQKWNACQMLFNDRPAQVICFLSK